MNNSAASLMADEHLLEMVSVSKVCFLEDSTESEHGVSPDERLYLRIIMQALSDLESNNLIHRASAICFFRSNVFREYLLLLGFEQTTVDLVKDHLKTVVLYAEKDLGSPEYALTHELFSELLGVEAPWPDGCKAMKRVYKEVRLALSSALQVTHNSAFNESLSLLSELE